MPVCHHIISCPHPCVSGHWQHCQTVCQDNLIWHDTTTCELWQVVHTVYTYIIITHGAAFGTFFRGYPPTTFYRSSYFQSGICVGSYHLRLVLIAGLESYSVSCSVSINCNLIVPLLRNPLIFERIAMGRCFPFFFYFPSSISFSPSSLVSSECLIFVFVPCCLFFSVNVFNFLFASHSHLFFWVLSYLIYVKSIWNQIWYWLLFPSLIVLFWACNFKGNIFVMFYHSTSLLTKLYFWHVGYKGYWLMLNNSGRLKS